VFRSVASRQYIFQVLMGRRHMLVLTLIARSILALSFPFSPLLFSIHRVHPRHPSHRTLSVPPILPSKRTYPRLPRGDIMSIKYSEAACGCGHATDLYSGITTDICKASSRRTYKIMTFNYIFYHMSLSLILISKV